jgi:multisubunit Na+/H+ antiporter MnhF subunit
MNFETIVILILALYSIAGLFRTLRGPTIWDRLLGFNLFSSKVIIISILLGVLIDRSYMIDVALIYGVLGFIGTIMIARFVERRGDI